MVVTNAAQIDDRRGMHFLTLALFLTSLISCSRVATAQATRGSLPCTPRPPDVVCPRESPIQRGSVQVGGTASFTRSRDIGNDQGWTTLELLPRVGYFVVRGLSVSANVRYRRISFDDQESVRNQTLTECGIGPGLTYFVSTSSPRVFPFVSARTLFIRGVNRADITPSPQVPEPSEVERSSRTRTHAWLGSAGAMYMLVNHVGITGEAFYQRDRVTIKAGETVEYGNSSELYGLQFGVVAFLF